MSGDLEVEAQSCACHRPSFQHAVLATTLERPAALAALFQDSRARETEPLVNRSHCLGEPASHIVLHC